MGKHFITQFTLDNTCGSKKKITPQKTADCKQKTNQKDPKKTGTNGTPGNAARGKTIGNDTGKFWNKYTCRIYSKKSKDSGNIAIFCMIKGSGFISMPPENDNFFLYKLL